MKQQGRSLRTPKQNSIKIQRKKKAKSERNAFRMKIVKSGPKLADIPSETSIMSPKNLVLE
jgi:hypothetical protein